MSVIRASWNMEIAILLGFLLTLILFFLIPAVCPGFPQPVMTHIYYSNISTPDGDRIYYLDGRITNEGTRGNVVITAELVNATHKTSIAKSTMKIYMLEGEQISVRIQLSGRADEPCDIRFTARRR